MIPTLTCSCIIYFHVLCISGPSVPKSLNVAANVNRRRRNTNANGDISLTVSWATPDDTNFDFYVISWDPSTQPHVQLLNDVTSHTISGLRPDTPYHIELYTTKRLNSGQVVESEVVTATGRTGKYHQNYRNNFSFLKL